MTPFGLELTWPMLASAGAAALAIVGAIWKIAVRVTKNEARGLSNARRIERLEGRFSDAMPRWTPALERELGAFKPREPTQPYGMPIPGWKERHELRAEREAEEREGAEREGAERVGAERVGAGQEAVPERLPPELSSRQAAPGGKRAERRKLRGR